MKGKMQGVTLVADWAPKPGFKLGAKDIEGRQTYLGSQVWRNPRIEMREYDIPTPGPEEVLLEVKACGICGSDVHMAQAEPDGYIFYPGLTGFPCILGHEFSGVVVEAGKKAFDKRTNKPFKGGEPVTSEEMLWCAQCRPCADGQPNHCERLDEVGFNVNGAYAKYMVLPARTIWSLEPLRKVYKGDDIFIAGSLIEPTSVAYNAVIERGGGIRPGDRVVILGGGPIGLAACAILKRAGASQVIISEPQEERTKHGAADRRRLRHQPAQRGLRRARAGDHRGHGRRPLHGGHRPADGRLSGHRARHLGRPDAEQPRRGDGPRRGQDAGDG